MASVTATELPAYLQTRAKYPSTLAPPGHGSNTFPALLPILTPYFDSLKSDTNSQIKRKVMEFSSGEGYHISRFSRMYSGIDFWASEADEWSCDTLRSLQNRDIAREGEAMLEGTDQETGEGKIAKILQLDFLVADQWDSLVEALALPDGQEDKGDTKGNTGEGQQIILSEESKLSGIWGINFLHMIPFPTGPEAIFSRLSSVMRKDGWAVFYGPFKKDEQGFHSAGDEQFNAMIKSRPSGESFGLRTVPSLAEIARKYDWEIKQQIAMPKGNWVLVFGAVQE